MSNIATNTFSPSTVLSLDIAKLLPALRFALKHAGDDGVHIVPNGGEIKIVATDSHRLSLESVACQTIDRGNGQGVTLRRAELAAALKATPKGAKGYIELSWGADPAKTGIRLGSTTIPMAKGTFPDYNQVIPKSGHPSVVTDLPALRDHLKALGKEALNKGTGVTVKVNAQTRALTLTLAETSRKAPKPAVASLTGPAPEAPKPGPVTASMGCTSDAGPEIATFGVCIRYLAEALPDAKTGAVVLSTEDNLSPIRVTSLQAPSRVVVVMPMHL